MAFYRVPTEFLLAILSALTKLSLGFHKAHNACTALSQHSHCAEDAATAFAQRLLCAPGSSYCIVGDITGQLW